MASKIIIVDENDNEIGLKQRGLETPEEIYRVSALWLKNSRGKFLLAQRSFQKKNNPGLWGPAVSGTVEEGETYESNIIKEAREELGLDHLVFTAGPKLRKTSPHNHFTQWFFLTLDKPLADFVIQKAEIESIKWFTKAEFLALYSADPKQFIGSINKYVELFN